MSDYQRFRAECMFGGSHVQFNPGGRLWEVYDLDKCDCDVSQSDTTVIDRIDEHTAKDLVDRLNAADVASRTQRAARAKV